MTLLYLVKLKQMTNRQPKNKIKNAIGNNTKNASSNMVYNTRNLP